MAGDQEVPAGQPKYQVWPHPANRADAQFFVGEIVMFPREPGALNPHARFDERGVKTGYGLNNETPANERAGNR